MENDKLESTQTNWSRIIVWSALIGLSIGAGLWFWQNSANLTADDQIVTGNVNRRPTVENTKPVVLQNDLPVIDRELESLGDKLAEASFHLREQQNDLARQALVEADELAVKTVDDPQLQENLVNGIKRAQSELNDGKTKETEQEINIMLNELNMPDN